MNALNFRLVVAIALIVGGMSFGALAPSTSHSVSELRPNLEPYPASELRIAYADGKKLLRFTTLTWNSGEGPLEIVPGTVDNATDKQRVYQRIYDTAGGYTDHFAGHMEWHEGHDHFHLNDYAHYTLRPVDSNGLSPRYGEKVSFCLMDTDRINHRLPGAPKRPQYTTCGADRQGISVGWGDAYRFDLEGQSIEITALPDGDYDLIIEVDPKGRLIETNDNDNTSTVRVRIIGDSVEVVTSSDGGGGDGPGNGNGVGRPPR